MFVLLYVRNSPEATSFPIIILDKGVLQHLWTIIKLFTGLKYLLKYNNLNPTSKCFKLYYINNGWFILQQSKGTVCLWLEAIFPGIYHDISLVPGDISGYIPAAASSWYILEIYTCGFLWSEVLKWYIYIFVSQCVGGSKGLTGV